MVYFLCHGEYFIYHGEKKLTSKVWKLSNKTVVMRNNNYFYFILYYISVVIQRPPSDKRKLMKHKFKIHICRSENGVSIFQQIRGLPMGSCSSGIMAIIFMDAIERSALQMMNRIPLFKRYVDDCLALVTNKE